MAKKYPKSQAIQDQQIIDNPESYITWGNDPKERAHAMKEMGKAVSEYKIVGHSQQHAHNRIDFSDLASNVSGRPGLTRNDYGMYRPQESVPTTRLGMLQAVQNAYDSISLVRNIIDLMGDFACQGIRLTHPNKRIEKFYRNWFERIQGIDRSERFLNNLYRTGAVIIRIQNAKAPKRIQQDLFKSVAESEIDINILKQSSTEIPWNYTFLSPTVVEVMGGPLASFVGDSRYAIKLPDSLARMIKSPKTQEEKDLVTRLPKEIKEAARTKKFIPLPPDRTEVFHYKKDDWQSWATPMLAATLKDLFMLDKLKLSDIAALDGAISNIRIFKLGSLQEKIAPTRAAVSKLAEVLESHTGAGTFDLVWGPDIELQESATNVHQFLGEEKYRPTLINIYSGLGIPPTLTGTFGAAGTTNNFVSLKTLVKRLEYGRMLLKNFWMKEIVKVQRAFGWRFSAKIEFDNMNLGDEESEKRLWIEMADRSLISDELLQHKFGHDPEMERIRINREAKDRDSGRHIPKAGPWHDPTPEESLKKLALQQGIVTPGEVGLDLEDRPEGEMPLNDTKEESETKNKIKEERHRGEPRQGSPKNSPYTQKRKTKKFTPRIKALELWAGEAQEIINTMLAPGLLKYFGKKNMRSLTIAEHKESEAIKFNALCYLKPYCTVEAKTVYASLQKGPVPNEISVQYNKMLEEATNQFRRKLTLDELRNIQACAYALITGERNGY